MKTDRELLELAAKAACVFMTPADWPYSDPHTPEDFALEFDEEDGSITGTRVWYGRNGDIGGTEKYTWRPLSDDGDALRLAATLGMDLLFTPDVVAVQTTQHGGKRASEWLNPRDVEIWASKSQDTYAATRRAIVRAAAEVGAAMPKKTPTA